MTTSVRPKRDWLRAFLPVILVVVVIVGGLLVLTARGAAPTKVQSWSAPVRIDDGVSASSHTGYSVSCPVKSFCLVATGYGTVYFWRSGKWSPPQSIAAGGSLDAVSCATSNFCVVVSDAGQAIIFNGQLWTQLEMIGPPAAYHVSCPTTSFCAAVGASDLPGKPSTIATFNGNAWSSQQTSTTGTTNDRLMDVSCTASRFCVAVNLDGQILTFTGTQWLPSLTKGPTGLISVSCVTENHCRALADSGASMTLQGKAWSAPSVIPGFKNMFGYSVACSSAENCVAMGLSGQATNWSSGKWSKPVAVFPGGFMSDVQVSCAKSGACMAVNALGISANY